jgi:folate-binding Fe-S cluster repair protein YgfZ
MYYIIYRDDSDHLCIMQREFETVDQAYLRLAWFAPESEARVVEKHKTIQERVVITRINRTLEKSEPVWRELKTEKAIPPEPTGKHHLAELLRQKLNGG